VLKSDVDGAALLAASLCAWPYPATAPTTFSKLAVALAIITQPSHVIMMNRGRHRGLLVRGCWVVVLGLGASFWVGQSDRDRC